jgi:hypothetical protein
MDLLITCSEATMMPMAECTINQSVVFAELGDEAVLLNTDTGIYFGLDTVGSRIWALLAEGMREEQIHGQLLREYAVRSDQLRDDIARFLRGLEDRGLVVRSTPA